MYQEAQVVLRVKQLVGCHMAQAVKKVNMDKGSQSQVCVPSRLSVQVSGEGHGSVGGLETRPVVQVAVAKVLDWATFSAMMVRLCPFHRWEISVVLAKYEILLLLSILSDKISILLAHGITKLSS